MYKNIIFDLGHVLVNSHPNIFLERHVPKEKQEKIFSLIFKGMEWQDLDRGIITEEEALESFIKKMPKEKELLENIFPKYLFECLSPNTENIACLEALKRKGYHLYVLSNFHKNLFEKIEKEWKLYEKFEGGIVSCYHKFLKPEKEIYKILLTKYRLNAEESVFIDDKIENIQAAEELGISGIHLPIQEDLGKKIAYLLK